MGKAANRKKAKRKAAAQTDADAHDAERSSLAESASSADSDCEIWLKGDA